MKKEAPHKMKLENDLDMRDINFITKDGIVKFQSTKGTHSVIYNVES